MKYHYLPLNPAKAYSIRIILIDNCCNALAGSGIYCKYCHRYDKWIDEEILY